MGLVDGNHVYLWCKHLLDQGNHGATTALRLPFLKNVIQMFKICIDVCFQLSPTAQKRAHQVEMGPM